MSKTKSKDLRAFALLLDKNGKLLVIKRGPKTKNAGKIGLPGGHVDAKESPKDAVIREVKEEVGVDIRTREGAGSFHFSIGIRHYFVFALTDVVEFLVNPDEVEAIRMVTLSWLKEQPEETLHTSVKDIMPWATSQFRDVLFYAGKFREC